MVDRDSTGGREPLPYRGNDKVWNGSGKKAGERFHQDLQSRHYSYRWQEEIGRDVPSSTLNTIATLKELFLNSISLLLTLESKYWARCTHGFVHLCTLMFISV